MNKMELKVVLKLLKPYRSNVRTIIIYALLISIISAVIPFVNSHMIDEGLLKGNISTIIMFVIVLVMLHIVDQLIQYCQTKQKIRITNALGREIKVRAFQHGLRLKPSYIREQSFYKTISDSLYDIGNVLSIVNDDFLIFFVIVCKAVGAGVGLIILDWRLTVLIAILIPIKYVVNLIMQRHVENLAKVLMYNNKNFNTWFSDILTGIIDIKLWNLNKQKVEEYEEHVQGINEASRSLSLLMEKSNIITQISEIAIMNLMYILGGVLITKGQLSFGNLVAFISFSSYLLIPVNIIMNIRMILKQIKPSIEGIKKFFSLDEENYSSSLILKNDVQKIIFQNVGVSIDGKDILKDISFEMDIGDKVALVGDNGSGKTTIINLILRIVQPTSGQIFLNGILIQEYNIEDYRKKFSVVTQGIHLFKGTIEENITFGKDLPTNVLDEKNIEFCTKTIEKWENKYKTEVGVEGDNLSGGERQKIALLRALSHSAEVLILDEATANYDQESEQKFMDFIKQNVNYNFYFIITHRSEMLSCVDKTLYLSSGTLTDIIVKHGQED